MERENESKDLRKVRELALKTLGKGLVVEGILTKVECTRYFEEQGLGRMWLKRASKGA
jgi:hypothetical protein